MRNVARQLGVQPRGVGDVGDQPIQAPHILLEDGQQPLARARVLDQVEGFHGRADRGQRVADLVGDIGGEPLDRIHPFGLSVGHGFQGPGQIPQFVVSASDVGQGDGPRIGQPHPVGGPGQLYDRTRHQPGQQQ